MQKAIEEKTINTQEILLIALLLGDPLIRKKKSWNELAIQFFNTYREEILSYYMYDVGPLNIERLVVNDPKLFIEYFSGMIRCGMFENCSYKTLANYIYMTFQTNYKKSHICNILKAEHEDYQDVRASVKQEKIKEQERKNTKHKKHN